MTFSGVVSFFTVHERQPILRLSRALKSRLGHALRYVWTKSAPARRTWTLHRVRPPRRNPSAALRVSYAHPGFPKPPPKSNVLVSGGKVKYCYLNQRLPHAGLRFDILYVVSSSRCHDVEQLIQIAQQRGAKVVWNQNGVYRAHSCVDPPRMNAGMARLYQRADYVFFQSEFCLNSARLFLGERSGPSEVLHNAIDTGFFVPQCGRLRTPTNLRLLMAGSHNDAYRLSCGVRTLAIVRRSIDAHLLIAGTVPSALQADLRNLVAELDLTCYVQFLGPYHQSAAPSVYQQGDIYLSTKYMDASPSAVIEAMACGLPVVHSNSGGTPELVGDAGLGVPAVVTWGRDVPPAPQELATRVLRVAEHLPRYAEAARQRAVERFDLRSWFRRHDRVFEALTGDTIADPQPTSSGNAFQPSPMITPM